LAAGWTTPSTRAIFFEHNGVDDCDLGADVIAAASNWAQVDEGWVDGRQGFVAAGS